MRTLLPLALALLATSAQAERLAYACSFTIRCDELGCSDNSASYQFRLDTETGSSEMIAGGQSYPGWYLASAEMHHFVFVNEAGIETTSITLAGEATYSGHMTIGGLTSWYRLEGQCSARNK